ncbi:hypothetical protein [Pseudoduganella chitinolytica]|uniref:ABC transporter permease n=1 Tax=Pseudoduganella chitinolytica TaxID=34070 RepID=A0ABY8BDZ7_9BURK|nr:hypothetical protein [Pseudoduganella chitinolytica]WEF34137.1 hypothetical protein PX653_05035 [Pseudoduganella chitinolytica]
MPPPGAHCCASPCCRGACTAGWVVWALLGGAVLAFAAFGIALSDWRAGMTSAGMFLTALLVAWWLELLRNAICLNEPALACLVPGQHRRIVLAVAGAWALGALTIGLLLGAAFDHVGYALLAAAAGLLYLAALQQWPWLMVAALAVMVLDRFVPLLPSAATRAAFMAAGETNVTLAGLALLLVPGAAVLRLLLPRGGDRHLAWQRRYEARAQAMRDALALPGREHVPAWRSSSWLQQPYLAGLRRLSERAGMGRPPRNRAQALLFALRAGAHPGAMLAAVAASTAFALAAGSKLGGGMDRDGLAGLACVMLLATPLVTHVHAVLTALQRYRIEQALLRLAPAAPCSSQFNRALGAALLARFALLWLTCTAGASLTVAAWDPASRGRGRSASVPR